MKPIPPARGPAIMTGLVITALLLGACGKSSPPAAAASERPISDRPSPAGKSAVAAQSPAARAPEPPTEAATSDEDVAPRPRPKVLLWVDGSPIENTIWRGWPALVRVQTLSGDAPSVMSLRGPQTVTPKPGKNALVIAGAETTSLPVGAYALVAAEQRVDVVVADAPRELTPTEQSTHFRLLVQSAIALGEAPAAREAAEAWAQAAPKSFEAHEARGDALRALGDSAAALEAYNEALKHVAPRIDPPPAGLHGKISELLRERATKLGTTRVTAVNAGESKDGAAASAVDEPREPVVGGQTRTGANPPTVAKSEKQHDATTPADDGHSASTSHTPTAPAQPSPLGGRDGMLANVVPATELADAQILADANGQWAVAAVAGSQYGATTYSANQTTGAPNVSVAGNSPDAWCPASKNDGTDWLEVTFAKAVHATEVRIRQNDTVGAIAKIVAIEPDGTAHLWWEGIDPYVAPRVREIVWFGVRLPVTRYLVARVKITLNLAAVSGWKEIDAVQLVGTQ